MRKNAAILATVGVAVIALVIGVAIGSVVFPATKTETSTLQITVQPTCCITTLTYTTPSTSIATFTFTPTPNMTALCTMAVQGNLIFTLENSSNGNPLGSVPIQVSYLAPYCQPSLPSNPPYTTLWQMTTNGSGIITVCCNVGQYFFSLTYSGINYYVNASIGAERATCVILGIPSGKVNITYSQTFQNVCRVLGESE